MSGENDRRDGRVPVVGTLRLVVNGGAGFLLAAGEVVDLSAGGCAVRVAHRELEPDLTGRIELALSGRLLSLPVVTRWVRAEAGGWLVGCRFFELNVKEQRAIQDLIIETCAVAIESKRSAGS